MARSFASLVDRQLQTTVGKADSRGRLIKAIHASARRWGYEQDERRAIQKELTGKGSLTDMSIAELSSVLDRFNADRRGQGLSSSKKPLHSKIRALWWTLYWLGEVDSPNDAALDAFVERQTGRSSLRFLEPRKSPAVIEALKAMIERAGVTVAAEAEGDAERWAVLRTLADKIAEYGTSAEASAAAPDRLRLALNLPASSAAWNARDLDDCIRALGKSWRRILSRKGGRQK